MNYLLRIALDTFHSVPKLFASARYTMKTVPDKLLNLCVENTRNKFTPKNTVGQRSHDDEIDKVLQIQIAGLMLKLFELKIKKRRYNTDYAPNKTKIGGRASNTKNSITDSRFRLQTSERK